MPLSHRPGHAQADFGQADGYIAGKKVRFHYFCVDLPQSDGCFVKPYPAETAEAFCERPCGGVRFFRRRAAIDPLRQSMDASRARRSFGSAVGMHESIRPTAGLFGPLALMGVRCFWPRNTIGLEGLVVDQASKLRSLRTNHQFSPRIRMQPLSRRRRAEIMRPHNPPYA